MIVGYQTVETLYESSRSLICRGWRQADLIPVVLKQLKAASPEAIARFKLEYEITRRLAIDGVINVYDLVPHDHTLVIIEEDFGGESLDRYISNCQLTLEEFLQLAIQVTEVLGEIHQQNVVHCDVNPSNILINPATGQIKLIDFGIATVLSPDITVFETETIEGTLAYISPEQTGRLNRTVDHRTDFYSLGVTFYQLLCDRLPFGSTDPLELIHHHIAKQPIPAHQLNSQIPQTVSDILMKLMAKNAEERYQSAWEIQADLRVCLSQLSSNGKIQLVEGRKQAEAVPISDHSEINSTALSTLNLTTVMKATQVLMREIELKPLLITLMKILIENTEAEQGYLILETNGQLVIEAEGTANTDHAEVLRSIPITEDVTNRVSTGIVNYVARTHENIIVGDVSQDERFTHDLYITQRHPKSVLCAPLINQSKLTGIVYLENNLTTDAFTTNHLEIIQLLSVQAAIAIDNARLYNELDTRVQQRTAELVSMNQQLEREIVERQHSEQTLRLIVEGTAAVTGKDFFHSLVRSLAQALNVYYAFITECDRSSPTRLRAIACWYQNEFVENFEYDIYGTACEKVINSDQCLCYPEQLQSLFPKDTSLPEMGAQSYAGIALRDSNGQLLGHLAILDDQPLADISRNKALLEIFAARAAAEMERQQAEDVIRVSQEKFSKAFRSSPSGITITTIKEGRFIEVNDSFLQMLGYDRQELMGQRSLDLEIWVRTSDRTLITQLLQEQGTVSNVEVELRRKSGETFLALVSADIIDLEDEPCLLGVTTDITVLKQAAKALERLAEIGELASMIVHEVRNPLTTMLMGLNTFKRLELSERFQEYLTLALDEGDRLQRLLNQILLYAKPQTLNLTELELNNFIADTLNTLRSSPAALARQLQFTSMLTPATVFVDRDKLKQVLINLVINACEAVNDGAIITVSLQRINANQAHIQIHNAGDPIPSEILSQLTKPFFTTKANGNGLGLAIVKRIVEAHRGELRIESSIGVGTTATVRLPLKC